MAKIVGSKILFRKPSGKSLEYPEGIQAEFTADLLLKFQNAAFPLQVELDKKLEDPTFLAYYLEECLETELINVLSDCEFGKGYMLGMMSGIYFTSQYMDDEEEDTDGDS